MPLSIPNNSFIPFVTAGHPDLETTREIILELASIGSAVVEIGIPFSDPIADGWTVYSSSRWTKNISAISGAVDKIRQLRGVYFDHKETEQHDIGLIAEEVGRVVPEAVVYEKNGVDAQSIDYDRLIPLFVEAIKEQQKQIEDLQAEVESLRQP